MDMINRCLLLLIVLVGLSSCESTVRPSFEIMDESELALYNASSSFDEQVICREDIDGWQIFSGAISFREQIEGSQSFANEWHGGLQRARRAKYRDQPKLCLSVRELKYLKRWEGVGSYTPSSGLGVESWQPADAADYPSTFN